MTTALRSTSFPDDHKRLPEGMTRVAYDADSSRYAFRDRAQPGTVFVGRPGEEYGKMVPESEAARAQPSRGLGRRPTLQAYDRPVKYADDQPQSQSQSQKDNERAHRFDGPAVNGTGMTFSDILPAHLLTAAPPMDAKKPHSPMKSHFGSSSSPGSHFHHGSSSSPKRPTFEEKRGSGSSFASPGGDAGRRSSGESELDSPRKSSFKSAARLVGRAATAFKGSKAQAVEKDHGTRGSYERI